MVRQLMRTCILLRLYVLKTILDYILVEERLDSFFVILGWAGPLLGILTGLIWGSITRQLKGSTIRGACIGSVGPFLLVMWLIYNGVIDHFGLDSVRGLMINLVIFAVIGAVIGIFFRRFRRPTGS